MAAQPDVGHSALNRGAGKDRPGAIALAQGLPAVSLGRIEKYDVRVIARRQPPLAFGQTHQSGRSGAEHILPALQTELAGDDGQSMTQHHALAAPAAADPPDDPPGVSATASPSRRQGLTAGP